eukprot:TRINITY_DN6036_c0_g1_i2.p1 TRINITY_DN6036_c0_g1~~TRINITY_DN6036_c0_g1_i2.p1  ORF type:complete len:1221 (-),score=167.51 TRINITY_DN6036_c0_g1_i2:221-3883(-)
MMPVGEPIAVAAPGALAMQSPLRPQFQSQPRSPRPGSHGLAPPVALTPLTPSRPMVSGSPVIASGPRYSSSWAPPASSPQASRSMQQPFRLPPQALIPDMSFQSHVRTPALSASGTCTPLANTTIVTSFGSPPSAIAGTPQKGGVALTPQVEKPEQEFLKLPTPSRSRRGTTVSPPPPPERPDQQLPRQLGPQQQHQLQQQMQMKLQQPQTPRAPSGSLGATVDTFPGSMTLSPAASTLRTPLGANRSVLDASHGHGHRGLPKDGTHTPSTVASVAGAATPMLSPRVVHRISSAPPQPLVASSSTRSALGASSSSMHRALHHSVGTASVATTLGTLGGSFQPPASASVEAPSVVRGFSAETIGRRSLQPKAHTVASTANEKQQAMINTSVGTGTGDSLLGSVRSIIDGNRESVEIGNRDAAIGAVTVWASQATALSLNQPSRRFAPQGKQLSSSISLSDASERFASKMGRCRSEDACEVLRTPRSRRASRRSRSPLARIARGQTVGNSLERSGSAGVGGSTALALALGQSPRDTLEPVLCRPHEIAKEWRRSLGGGKVAEDLRVAAFSPRQRSASGSIRDPPPPPLEDGLHVDGCRPHEIAEEWRTSLCGLKWAEDRLVDCFSPRTFSPKDSIRDPPPPPLEDGLHVDGCRVHEISREWRTSLCGQKTADDKVIEAFSPRNLSPRGSIREPPPPPLEDGLHVDGCRQHEISREWRTSLCGQKWSEDRLVDAFSPRQRSLSASIREPPAPPLEDGVHVDGCRVHEISREWRASLCDKKTAEDKTSEAFSPRLLSPRGSIREAPPPPLEDGVHVDGCRVHEISKEWRTSLCSKKSNEDLSSDAFSPFSPRGLVSLDYGVPSGQERRGSGDFSFAPLANSDLSNKDRSRERMHSADSRLVCVPERSSLNSSHLSLSKRRTSRSPVTLPTSATLALTACQRSASEVGFEGSSASVRRQRSGGSLDSSRYRRATSPSQGCASLGRRRSRTRSALPDEVGSQTPTTPGVRAPRRAASSVNADTAPEPPPSTPAAVSATTLAPPVPLETMSLGDLRAAHAAAQAAAEELANAMEAKIMAQEAKASAAKASASARAWAAAPVSTPSGCTNGVERFFSGRLVAHVASTPSQTATPLTATPSLTPRTLPAHALTPRMAHAPQQPVVRYAAAQPSLPPSAQYSLAPASSVPASPRAAALVHRGMLLASHPQPRQQPAPNQVLIWAGRSSPA